MVRDRELFIDFVKSLIVEKKFTLLIDMEEEVISRNIAELSYWYAYKVPTANIGRHEDVVAGSKDLVWIYSFARSIKKANIERLGNLVIESGDSYYNYIFANNIEKADNKRHGMVIFWGKDPEYNYLFARDIRDADIKLHEKAVALSGNERFISKFMRDIPGADLDMLSNAIIRGNNPYWNYVIARDYAINVLEHGNVVYRSLNPEYNYKFAEKVEGADIKLHEKAVCLSDDSEYIAKFNNLIEKRNKVKKLVREKIDL